MENFKTASGRIPMSWLQYKMDSHKVNTDLICSVTLVSLTSSTVIVKLIYFQLRRGQHT